MQYLFFCQKVRTDTPADRFTFPDSPDSPFTHAPYRRAEENLCLVFQFPFYSMLRAVDGQVKRTTASQWCKAGAYRICSASTPAHLFSGAPFDDCCTIVAPGAAY